MADGKVIIATELDTKDAEKSAQGFGSKLGKGFTALGVGLASVGATATATAGKIVKSSLEAYASYEQLVGGVETLFKDSADQVKKYADEAYKTAGMSANQYMETVTSFSASLLQGLEGDTEKASKKANKAIIDMSDNANKMGTSMEMIQNAYQGFAKQNYTMLDNLKLGYGGTASEMARLVRDSGVLGEAGKDLTAKNLNEKVSFDQIVDAIHKVQTNMGITGTTSKEASTTIEGSVNSMKAAWENLLTSFGDKNQDTSKKVKEFTKSVETVLKNVLPVAEQVLKGLGETVSKIAPTFLAKIPPLIEKFLPKFMSAGTGIISAIITGLAKAIPSLIKMIPEMMGVVIDNIQNALEVLSVELPSAFGILASALSGIVELFGGFLEVLTSSTTQGEMLRVLLITLISAYMAYQVATSIATTAMAAFNAVMDANPIFLMITAIGGLIGLMVTLSELSAEDTTAKVQSINEETNAIRERTQAREADLEKQRQQNEAHNNQIAKTQESIDSHIAEMTEIRRLAGELDNLVDAQGRVKKGKEAQVDFILNQLNGALGTEYKLVGNQVQQYDKLQKSILETITAKTNELLFKDAEQGYTDAIKKKANAQKKSNKALLEYNAAKTEFDLYQMKTLPIINKLEEEAQVLYRKGYDVAGQKKQAEANALRDSINARYQDMLSAQKVYKTNKGEASKYYAEMIRYQSAYQAAASGNNKKAQKILSSSVGKYKKLGEHITDGVANGMTDEEAMKAVETAAGTISKKTLKALKKKWNIKSPSRVAKKEIGENIGAGIAEGIVSGYMENDPTKQLSADIMTSMGTLQTSINASMDLKTNIGGIAQAVVDGIEQSNMAIVVNDRELGRAVKGALS